MTKEELDSKIEEIFLENKIGIPECLSYGAFRRIAIHFYQMGRDDVLTELHKHSTPI